MTSTTVVRQSDPSLHAAVRVAVAFAIVKLALHFAATLWSQHLGYGYFRDEFYYLVCGRHLAWGYVDHGPIVALQARVGEMLFGHSVFAIRILSAVAGAAAVFITGVLTWAMGGGRAAQVLAMLSLLFAPLYLGVDSYLSMNSFEPAFWSVCVLALLRLQDSRPSRFWWVIFGAAGGVGLLNKPSMLFFLIALGLGLLATPERRILLGADAAMGIAVVMLLAAPNVFWQVRHHWPTLEFLHNGATEHKNIVLGPMAFFGAQLSAMHPLQRYCGFLASSLWCAAVASSAPLAGCRCTDFFRHDVCTPRQGLLPGRYLPGAVRGGKRCLAASLASFPRRILRAHFRVPDLRIRTHPYGHPHSPMALPVFSPGAWVRYTTALHLYGHSGSTETNDLGPLPQFYADRFGWHEEVAEVSRIFNSLPPEDQARVGISCSNYGEASALNILGPSMNPHLPSAISGHNNYFLWGPGNATGDVMIVISGGTLADVRQTYDDVVVAGSINHPLAMPYEHRNIYLARNRRQPITAATWKEWKRYI